MVWGSGVEVWGFVEFRVEGLEVSGVPGGSVCGVILGLESEAALPPQSWGS